MTNKIPEKLTVCLSSSGHYPDEYREITKEEYKKLERIERKYSYLDKATGGDNIFVQKILKRKKVEILEIIKYC